MLPKPKLLNKPILIPIQNDLSFIQIFQKIEPTCQNCFLLESLAHLDFESRYSVIGFEPAAIVSSQSSPNSNSLDFEIFHKENFCNYDLNYNLNDNIMENMNNHLEANLNNCLQDNFQIQCQNPFFELRNLFDKSFSSESYLGGLVGYFGYDSVNYLQNSIQVDANPNHEAFKFGIYFDGIIMDKYTNKINYFYYNINRYDFLTRIIAKEAGIDCNSTAVELLGNNITKAQYLDQFENIKNEILLGNTFQCELGFQSNYVIHGSILEIYKELRQVNPSPYMYYFKFDNQFILGASPELLYSQKNGQMQTSPAAGTAKRGSTPEEDKEYCYKLLNNPKEVAEHLMLVDMHRNDLGKNAKIGSVGVQRLMDVRKFAFVQHLVSDIVATLDPSKDMFDAIGGILPGGVLTGAPKLESIKIIQRNETSPRGPYGGGGGMLGFNNDCTLCITIRGLFVKDGHAYSQTCSGIVLDSDPEVEYMELTSKLKAMNNVLNQFK